MKQLFMDLSKIALIIFPLLSFSQQSNFNRSQLPHSTGSLTIHDGIDSYKGLGRDNKFHLSLGYEYVESPYILIDGDKDIRLTEVIKDFTRYQLTTGYFFSKNLYIGANVPFDQVTSKPYIPGQLNNNILSDPFSQESSSLGDIVLMAKYKLGDYAGGWNWTLIPKLSLPTGSEEAFNTDAEMSYALYAAWTKYFGADHKWRFYGNLGFKYAPDSRLKISALFEEFETKQRAELGLGIGYEVFKNFTASFEFKGFQAFPFNDGQNPIEITLGGAYQVSNTIRVYAGLGLEGTLGETYNNDTRYFAGLSFGLGARESHGLEAYQEKSQKNFIAVNSELDRSKSFRDISSLPYRELKKKEVLVNFETKHSYLSSQSSRELVGFASLVLKHLNKITEITIEGHTDSRGELNSNTLLSQERARRIKNLLILHKVPERIIRVRAYGELDLDSKESDEFGLYKNRRAEVYISGLKRE